MKIQGAIFDMDGTLVDTLMLWDVMWEHFGKLYRGVEGFRPDPLFEKELRTMVLRDAMVCIHAELGMGEDADELLRELKNCRQGTLCPHGRPTMITLSLREIEKRFGRR